MADPFQFDLVAPERRLASMEATAVTIPGADGDLTVMARHAPVITSLRPGILRVETPGETQEFVVTGGFAEINDEGVTVLAERSLPRGEVSQEVFDQMVAEAAEAHRKAREGADHGIADDTAKLLADMVAMGSHIGLDPKQPNL
jgi:F-type H+-transporting ATPase subunit epsilon